MKRNKTTFLVIFILLVLFLLTNISKATTNNEKYSFVNENNTSKEYQKWLELPDEEKKNYIMPFMHTIDLNKSTSEDIEAQFIVLSPRYSLKDELDIKVRNQQNTGFCWGFASSKVFETTYAKLNNKTTLETYSPRHMVYATSRYFNNNVTNPIGFNRDVKIGGNYMEALAYWTNGSGPVLEKDMPFVDSMERINISEIQNKKVQAQLEDATLFPNIYKTYDSLGNVTYSNGQGTTYTENDMYNFRLSIKFQLINCGAVGSMTYVHMSEANNYFSSIEKNCYYCDNPDLLANHAITIVGWDDNFSKENFDGKSKPKNDGAYIVLNSYGNEWGDNGYYYISYDDYFIENAMFGIQGISNIDYDNIYQYDELGMSSYLSGVNNSTKKPLTTIYAGNCFNKKTSSNEKLSEIGIYIYNNNTNVSIYLNKNGKDLNISNLDLIATANNLTCGYHTIKLENQITIGNNFSIVVKYSNNSIGMVPLEMPISAINGNEEYETVSTNLGESFVSFNGTVWNDITTIDKIGNIDYSKANVCIKAFTVNETQNPSGTNYIKNTNWKLINGNNVTMLSGIDENTTISELLSPNNFDSNYTVKAYKNEIQITEGKATTGTVIKIFEGSNIVKEYTIIIYGDTTGDGNIQASDALAIVKNNLDTVHFKNEIYLEAGRVILSKRNTESKPNAIDALACIKHKLGVSMISQY